MLLISLRRLPALLLLIVAAWASQTAGAADVLIVPSSKTPLQVAVPLPAGDPNYAEPEWIAYDDLHVRWVSDLHDGIDFGGVKYCGLVRRRRRSEAVVDVEKEISACEEFLEQHGIVKEV